VKRFALLGSFAAIVACVAVAAASSEPPLWAAAPLGLVKPHGQAGKGGGGSGQSLVYHGGQIMNDAKVTAIYWGTNWGNPSFAGDKMTGLATFYNGIGGSSYIGTNTEYTGSNGQVGTGVTVGRDKVDTLSSLTRAPSTADVLAEVSSQISNPTTDGYYPVYTDLPRGSAGYCAWHSWGTVHGVLVQFAFFFNLDGDPGCDPQDPSTTHSQGLEALANVSGHELSEALTDPHGDAWYDRRGQENADKCAWTFNGSESFSNGSSWYVQGNWSNNAAAARTGYDGAGCINGN
jgi:hypothetical protein